MDNTQGVTKMNNLKAAVARQIQALKDSALQVPECADEYQNMAWGVFGLWMNLAGYEPMDENEEIAQMRDFCTRWN